MTNAGATYSVLVLFGTEGNHSVASPQTFAELSDSMARVLGTAGCALKTRGRIESAAGKNAAPRQAPWTPSLRDRYVQALNAGRFQAIEQFDAEWGSGHYPSAYGAIRKLWGFGPTGPTERTSVGAENNITLAVQEGAKAAGLEQFKATAREMLEKIDCFYGFIETGVPWDRPRGPVYEDMIDIRWHNRANVDYRNGKYQMKDSVPRLYRGNLFCPSQLRGSAPGEICDLPDVTLVEAWPLQVTYLQLSGQPPYGSKPSREFERIVSFTPPT